LLTLREPHFFNCGIAGKNRNFYYFFDNQQLALSGIAGLLRETVATRNLQLAAAEIRFPKNAALRQKLRLTKLPVSSGCIAVYKK
jgi:hypothetical protein